jgi:exopolysaccharide production protein ExoZ
MTENIRRIEGFDLLRGLCAIGVAVYHLLYWSNTAKLYNVGTYGVYIFFILSGASLYLSYSSRLTAGLNLADFLLLRYFRLAPLYILAVIAVPLVENVLVDQRFVTYGLLNITLLFGFINPGQSSVVTGGWSLGIEVVFYFIFPMVVAFISKRWTAALLALSIAFIAQIIAIDRILEGDGALVKNWVTYIQPLSFVFYFIAGCLIGRLLRQYPAIRLPGWVVWMVFVGCLILITLTSKESVEKSLGGINGIIMMILCVAAVYCSGYLYFGSKASTIAVAFGNMSYGIYLLHTFAHVIIARFNIKYAIFPKEYINLHIGLVVFVTATISLLINRYYEQPIRNAAKQRFLNN